MPVQGFFWRSIQQNIQYKKRPAALSTPTGIASRSVWGLACLMLVSSCSRKLEILGTATVQVCMNLLVGFLGDLRSAPKGRSHTLQYRGLGLHSIWSTFDLPFGADVPDPGKPLKGVKVESGKEWWGERSDSLLPFSIGDVPPWDIRIMPLHGAIVQHCWSVWSLGMAMCFFWTEQIFQSCVISLNSVCWHRLTVL